MDVTAPVSIAGLSSLQAYGSSGLRGPEVLGSFLPPPGQPGYMQVLTELVRADLEHHWAAGVPLRLDAYRPHFPELLTDPHAAATLASAEARLLTGTFSGRFSGYRTVGVDQTPPPVGGRLPSLSVERTRAIPEVRATDYRPVRDLPSSSRSTCFAPETPVRPAARFPAVGDTFSGFRLVAELGSGAFARVFLAEQTALAGRPVALKVTTRPTREPQQLAKLRHTNVVPIYSVHSEPPLQAVCMPYLGRHTLADLIREYRSTGVFPRTATPSTTLGATVRTVIDTGRGPTTPPASPRPTPATRTATRAAAPAGHVALALDLLTRMAEGLAHAHEVGILHLDLKPANVLLADDGQPLLLDFNLAFDVRLGDRERAGGTLPYMAPEQLDEYVERGPTRVDHRTDLYALGVIAYELLTGRHPFPHRSGEKANPTEMAKHRRAGAPSVRAANPTISRAVESIVRKLLDPAPADRYQSARDLLTDLDRHRQNLPLLFAPDRSVTERVRKWRRRHPRLLAQLLLASAVVASAGLAAAAVLNHQRHAVADATIRAAAVHDELARLRIGLALRDDARSRSLALDRGQRVLAGYGLPDDAAWSNRSPVTVLPEPDRAALADDLGELALLMAHAEWVSSLGKPDSDRAAAADRARVWNRAAELCYAGRPAPLHLERQRERLADAPSRDDLDPAATNTDLYLHAATQTALARYAAAAAPLLELTRRDPGHYGGQFLLAVCRHKTWDLKAALERYQIAQALAAHDPRPAYNRGLILLHDARSDRGKYRLAEAEFTDAIRRDPTHADSWTHRAIARSCQADYAAAADDLTKALELGASPIQVHSLRASVYERLGDRSAAAADRQAAADLTPAEPMDYLARGVSRLKAADAEGSLADFERAAELNPFYVQAWQNQAHVLADVLKQPERALVAQQRAVECNPDFALARSGLAVLNARLGRRDEAHQDAEAALLLSDSPVVLYQAACVYALTGEEHPDDLPRAARYFRQALRAGYQDFKTVETDPDLTALRNLPDFRDTLTAAKKLAK